ncbi:MAG: PAS domain-containing sensor histidine kinase [Polaromonas sp.]|uniref:PAS domain-containing sensor histidine kinase n=1 Tax=Polaromonas sp. TaxID=1869339 RepID=UPI001842FFD5|nr:PAS domain-containing sensor histidine kinase [Polaromonas sp.]MBA3593972.1 PAS domain-containing sensor histidine kinase [Polaromonas sp.]
MPALTPTTPNVERHPRAPSHPVSRTIPEGTLGLTGRWLLANREHAFICMDVDGIITAWLGAAEEILGYRAEEVIGHNLAAIFTPEDQARGFDKYELAVASVNSRSEDDRWHLRKDGTRIWATGAVSSVRDDDGKLVGFIKILRDRTDLRTQLESLETALVAQRESRERTHQFLKTLGHELRNPLAPLSTATHIIRRLAPDPRIDGALQIIARQVAALTRLADDLMDVTRLETGKVEPQLQRMDLCRFLEDVVVSLQETAAGRSLTLVTLRPASALEIDMDESLMQRLVLNLLGNAIKYTPEGGNIWIKVVQEGTDVVFRVEDTGIGIAPDVLPRIFELFTQERAASDMVPGGLGVGLAMVREIAELHGGSVQARSAGEGRGSEFTVRLPAIAPN